MSLLSNSTSITQTLSTQIKYSSLIKSIRYTNKRKISLFFLSMSSALYSNLPDPHCFLQRDLLNTRIQTTSKPLKPMWFMLLFLQEGFEFLDESETHEKKSYLVEQNKTSKLSIRSRKSCKIISHLCFQIIMGWWLLMMMLYLPLKSRHFSIAILSLA